MKEYEIKARIKFERERRSVKITGYTHHGFDFDGAAGHDVLITDTIVNRIFSAFQK